MAKEQVFASQTKAFNLAFIYFIVRWKEIVSFLCSSFAHRFRSDSSINHNFYETADAACSRNGDGPCVRIPLVRIVDLVDIRRFRLHIDVIDAGRRHTILWRRR